MSYSSIRAILPEMTYEYGYIRTANAISVMYDNDLLTEGECLSLRRLVAEDAPRHLAVEIVAAGVAALELPEDPDYISAELNKCRLENNQMTKWVDNQIHDYPRPQLVVGVRHV